MMDTTGHSTKRYTDGQGHVRPRLGSCYWRASDLDDTASLLPADPGADLIADGHGLQGLS